MLQIDTDRGLSGAAEPAVALERMVLFVVGEHRFGVPIDRIREIIPARPYTPLPGGEAFVCGLINLRGRIVTVVDLGARLGLAPASAHPDHSIVIVEYRGKLVGLAVQEVARIVAVDPDTLQSSAETLRSLRIDRAYLRGVGEADDEIFVAVEPDEILDPILV
ncbi:MAG: CheW protein [Gemmatimonadetes bacterium]|nr:CheW protein [Gemmatimonadota bacterium]